LIDCDHHDHGCSGAHVPLSPSLLPCPALLCSADHRQRLMPQLYYVSTSGSSFFSGGMLDDAWFFLRDNGLPEEACDPYTHCPYPAVSSCKAPAPPPTGHCDYTNQSTLDAKPFRTFGTHSNASCSNIITCLQLSGSLPAVGWFASWMLACMPHTHAATRHCYRYTHVNGVSLAAPQVVTTLRSAAASARRRRRRSALPQRLRVACAISSTQRRMPSPCQDRPCASRWRHHRCHHRRQPRRQPARAAAPSWAHH
jgi:hypothetical protein